MSRVYSRGLNFMGQLGLNNKKTNTAQFQEIKSLAGRQIVQAEAYLAQSACLLGDGQILNWGWPLDSLTTARTLSYYKRAPALAKFWQKYSILGGTLGMRSGVDEPILLNKGLLMKHKPTKFSLGGCYLLCLTSDGDVYGSGENYKGQLGTGDIKFKFDFAIIPRSGGYKMVDISTGFQHSLTLADDGSCYASGRTNWRQFLPYFTKPEDKQIQYDFYRSPQKIIFPGEKILKASAGFSHSLFYTSKDKLYAIGLNNFGQCGQSSLNRTSLSDYIEVFMDLEHDERIVDIKCGKSHNIFLTNKGNVYGFGASSHNQLNWRNEADLEVCAPRKIELPLRDENVVKIKATLDRNAVITDKGNCYVWGGEDFSKIGGEKNGELENLRDSLPGKPRVKDVGLGFMHTIAVTEE